MSASVAWLHQIVEGDPSPLAIPARPMPRSHAALSPAIECHEMRGRILTYQVVHADHGLVGYLRRDQGGDWIARTTGSADDAASIRTFTDKAKAAEWLQRRLAGGRR